MDQTPTPTTSRIATIGLSNLATTGLKAVAGAFVAHGWMNSSNTETFVSIGVLVLTYGYSFWKDYGRDIATAALTILRARVLNAAEQAKRSPQAAPAAIASVAAHVEATAAVSAPAGPAGPSTGV
jgi:hypothetical protein